MKLVVLGLSLSSSWGNGHATTYRALLKAFAARGHQVLFLERDVPWYADQRDLPDPDWCQLEFYRDLTDLNRFDDLIATADSVIVGSFVPDGVAVGERVQRLARGVRAFYDIDTPVTLAKLARAEFEYLAPRLIPGYDVYLSFTGGPTLAVLEEHYGSPAARPLYCSVDPALYHPTGASPRWDLSYLGTYSPDRQPTLERLLIEPARALPNHRFVVAGAQYPDDTAWPANVEHIAHLPPAEHAAFYSASRATLNVTRADMIATGWAPSVRLFEAAACATPIISDIWPGLDQIFAPDSEILLARTGADIVAALQRQDLADIGICGRQRVLAEHTAAHRAAELEHHLVAATRPDRTHGGGPNDASPLILVAGGAGFIGSHLCARLLDEGNQVLCLDNLQTARPSNLRLLEQRPGFRFIEADIVNPLPDTVVAVAHRITRIYNLACAASPPQYQADPEHTMLTNVVGTNHLLRLAERVGARVLLTSTSEVYGDPEMHPQREDYRGSVNCTGPRACYDEGKRAAEALAFDYVRMHRAQVRVARIFNTYGPQMHPDDGRVVSNLICQALSDRDITIFGDGSQTRSFCYVSDMVEALMRLMESDIDGSEPINLGNPIELTVSDLARRVVALTGTTNRVIYHPLPQDDPVRRRPDITRAHAVLGWSPKVTLEEGLMYTCAWFAVELGEPARIEANAPAQA